MSLAIHLQNNFILSSTVLRGDSTILCGWEWEDQNGEVGCSRSHSSVNRLRYEQKLATSELVIIIPMLQNCNLYCLLSSLCLPINGYSRDRHGERRGHLPCLLLAGLAAAGHQHCQVTSGTLKASELGILRTPIFSCYNNQISLRCTLGHTDHPLEVCDRWTPADTGSICPLEKLLRGRSGRYPTPPWTRDPWAHSWAWGLLEDGAPQTPFHHICLAL